MAEPERTARLAEALARLNAKKAGQKPGAGNEPGGISQSGGIPLVEPAVTPDRPAVEPPSPATGSGGEAGPGTRAAFASGAVNPGEGAEVKPATPDVRPPTVHTYRRDQSGVLSDQEIEALLAGETLPEWEDDSRSPATQPSSTSASSTSNSGGNISNVSLIAAPGGDSLEDWEAENDRLAAAHAARPVLTPAPQPPPGQPDADDNLSTPAARPLPITPSPTSAAPAAETAEVESPPPSIGGLFEQHLAANPVLADTTHIRTPAEVDGIDRAIEPAVIAGLRGAPVEGEAVVKFQDVFDWETASAVERVLLARPNVEKVEIEGFGGDAELEVKISYRPASSGAASVPASPPSGAAPATEAAATSSTTSAAAAADSEPRSAAPVMGTAEPGAEQAPSSPAAARAEFEAALADRSGYYMAREMDARDFADRFQENILRGKYTPQEAEELLRISGLSARGVEMFREDLYLSMDDYYRLIRDADPTNLEAAQMRRSWVEAASGEPLTQDEIAYQRALPEQIYEVRREFEDAIRVEGASAEENYLEIVAFGTTYGGYTPREVAGLLDSLGMYGDQAEEALDEISLAMDGRFTQAVNEETPDAPVHPLMAQLMELWDNNPDHLERMRELAEEDDESQKERDIAEAIARAKADLAKLSSNGGSGLPVMGFVKKQLGKMFGGGKDKRLEADEETPAVAEPEKRVPLMPGMPGFTTPDQLADEAAMLGNPAMLEDRGKLQTWVSGVVVLSETGAGRLPAILDSYRRWSGASASDEVAMDDLAQEIAGLHYTPDQGRWLSDQLGLEPSQRDDLNTRLYRAADGMINPSRRRDSERTNRFARIWEDDGGYLKWAVEQVSTPAEPVTPIQLRTNLALARADRLIGVYNALGDPEVATSTANEIAREFLRAELTPDQLDTRLHFTGSEAIRLRYTELVKLGAGAVGGAEAELLVQADEILQGLSKDGKLTPAQAGVFSKSAAFIMGEGNPGVSADEIEVAKRELREIVETKLNAAISAGDEQTIERILDLAEALRFDDRIPELTPLLDRADDILSE